MSFEDRVRSTVDQAIGSLVQQLLAQATEERDEAVRAARRLGASKKPKSTTQARVADAEARVRAIMEEAIETGRRRGTRHRRRARFASKVEAEVEPKMNEAVALAESARAGRARRRRRRRPPTS